MEPRFQVVHVTPTTGYVLDTSNARKMSTSMNIKTAEILAENLNIIHDTKGAK